MITLRSWQPQRLAWLSKLEQNYHLEAPLTVRLIGGTISIVRTQTKRRRETIALDAQTEHEIFSDLDRFLTSRDSYRQRRMSWRRGWSAVSIIGIMRIAAALVSFFTTVAARSKLEAPAVTARSLGIGKTNKYSCYTL